MDNETRALQVEAEWQELEGGLLPLYGTVKDLIELLNCERAKVNPRVDSLRAPLLAFWLDVAETVEALWGPDVPHMVPWMAAAEGVRIMCRAFIETKAEF